jgi:O-antigen ligase
MVLFGILIPLMITFVYLTADEKNIIGLIGFAVLFLGVASKLTSKWQIPFVFCLLVAMHGLEISGMQFTRFISLGVMGLLVLFGFMNLNVLRSRPLLVSVLVIIGFHTGIFLIQPYVVNKLWILLYIQGALLFALVQMNRWKISDIRFFITAHLSYLVLWGLIERLVSDVDRISGPTMSATAFGVLLAIEWGIWITFELLQSKIKWVPILLLSPLVVLVMFFSGTRMAFIGVAIALLLASILKQHMKSKGNILGKLVRFIPYLVGISIILGLVWFLLPQSSFLKQGLMVFMSGKLDLSSIGRIMAWTTGLDAFQKHPFFGIGPGNFMGYMGELMETMGATQLIPNLPILGHAHNVVILVLSEHGFMGILMLGSVVGYAVFRLVRYVVAFPTEPLGYALGVGFVIMMTLGMVDVVPLFPSTVCFGAWFMGILYQLPDKQEDWNGGAASDQPIT